MGLSQTRQRSRVPWALALAVGLSSGLAGYVIHVAQTRRIPKQVVRVQRLTDMVGVEESPAISPNGKSIAFVAMVGGRRQIWVQQLSGGAPQVITKDDADHTGPRWFPDSQSLIYFASDNIWRTSAAGGLPLQMRVAGGTGDLSHDGIHLAFFRAGDENGVIELKACQADICATVTTLSAGNAHSNMRWSPDDRKIAYLEDTRIMVIDATGGKPVQAVQGLIVQGFTWAPDNSGLIVSTHGELWFIPRVEGRPPSQLTFGELSYESPDISQGGTLVVSRRGLGMGTDTDIVMFTGLKW
jgi:hypothetical protein